MTLRRPYFIQSSAPTRICDNGGWTDTWFAKHGKVFNIAIEPRIQVRIAVHDRNLLKSQVRIAAANFGDTYARELGTPWQKYPLIEAAIEQVAIPEDVRVFISIRSDAPPGASLGTSAAMTVALLGALDYLSAGGLSAQEIADQAHQVETEQLGWQSGIQDQIAAAHGGISYINMHEYPHASVTSLRPEQQILKELETRLLVVCMEGPRHSSQVHESVIAHLEHAGPDEPRLAFLRQMAAPARDALLAGDFVALGQAFINNTEGQRALHPKLINPVAQKIIDLAQKHGAVGWKVNGAGGEGGSVALLLDGSAERRHQFVRALQIFDKLHLITPRLTGQGLQRSTHKPTHL